LHRFKSIVVLVVVVVVFVVIIMISISIRSGGLHPRPFPSSPLIIVIV
jgi:hypothetical protein